MELWSDSEDDSGWYLETTQSGLGNCYLIAAFISASTKPTYIKNAFVQQETNQAGIYTVKFFIRGKPMHINIDDSIIFDRDIL